MFGSVTCGALEPFLSVDGVDEIFNGVEKKKKKVRVLRWSSNDGDRDRDCDSDCDSDCDWAIVVATSEFDSKTYHVHRSVLGAGPRKSVFFSKLFRKGNKAGSNSTRIQLDEQDAESFPLFLDFVYGAAPGADESNSKSLKLNVREDFGAPNAVSLRHLAKVFDCEGLTLAVNTFIQKDLSLRTGPVYLVEAHHYEDNRLIESSKRLCIENFALLDTRAIVGLPPELFQSVMSGVIRRAKSAHESTPEEENALGYHVGEVVCQYFEKNPHELSAPLLLELTDEEVIKEIAPEPAIGITALIRDLDAKEIRPNSGEWRGVVGLSQRCARAIVREYGWKDFNVKSALEEYLYGPCADGDSSSTKLDSLLFATSFAATLEGAQNETRTPFKKQGVRLQQQNDELQRQNQKLKEEVDQYKSMAASTKEEYLLLKEQVKSLKRRQNF
ncbi:unnamed protein product [Pseudo-nitzschia multistriata]|uniref:BTB domain-containing protein n=1 Tax=Pseudo-nitzschia multistriata TaxID=183589 RepID=A0A448Z2W0_9STRA|nr:unnamed protein product [Pseudo-nitzschia multistriata]